MYEIQVHAGAGDRRGEVGEHARPVVDLDDHDLALPADPQMGVRERMPDGLGVRDEDVELRAVAVADAGGRGEVDARVGDGTGDLGERTGRVLDVDDQVERHLTQSSLPAPRRPAPPRASRSLRSKGCPRCSKCSGTASGTRS
jgi:hypothetical protein